MSRFIRSIVVFLLSVIWFSLFQPWGAFNDPDAFFHAKIASLIAERGALMRFPWLDLTLLDQHFFDQHFLFHLLLIPFQKIFGILLGTQVAAVFFSAALLTIFYLLLRWLKIQQAEFWIFLCAISSPLLVRLSLAKASPLALIWFLLGIAVLLKVNSYPPAGLAGKLKAPFSFLSGFGFALSHGGWMILLICQVLCLIGQACYARVVDRAAWKEVISWFQLKTVFLTSLGIFIGLLIHPNRGQAISFLWTQVVQVGLVTPIGRVFLGGEWLPIDLGQLLLALSIFVILGLGLLFGFLSALRRPFDESRARQVIMLALPVAAVCALTLKSYRFVEYLVPLLVLWFACAWSLIDPAQFWYLLQQRWRSFMSSTHQVLRSIFFSVLGCLLIVVFVHEARVSFLTLHAKVREFDQFALPMREISRQAEPGDRVFHSNWDQFPQLFVLDDRLRYVAGLDPTFLLAQNPVLSDLYRDLTLGRVTSSVVTLMHERFGARFIFVEPLGHEILAQAIRLDEQAILLYRDQQFEVYEIENSSDRSHLE